MAPKKSFKNVNLPLLLRLFKIFKAPLNNLQALLNDPGFLGTSLWLSPYPCFYHASLKVSAPTLLVPEQNQWDLPPLSLRVGQPLSSTHLAKSYLTVKPPQGTLLPHSSPSLELVRRHRAKCHSNTYTTSVGGLLTKGPCLQIFIPRAPHSTWHMMSV